MYYGNRAATYDGSTMRVYVNGRPSSVTAAQTTIFNGTAPFCIGCRYGGGSPVGHSTANIDEVKVYSYALSDDQIQSEFNQGASTVMGSTSTESNGITVGNSNAREYCVPGDSSTCNAPIAEWKLDSNSGTSALDTSGNAITGSFVSSPVWTRGKVGSALNFDGTDDYLNMGNNSLFAFGTAVTFQAWIRPESYNPNGGMIINKWVSGFEDKQLTVAGDGRAYFFLHNTFGGSVLYTNSTIPLNQWTHIAGVYTGSTARMFINGRLDSSRAASGDVADSTGIFYIGGNPDRGSFAFDGSIDDIKIYNYARTPAQVNWDFSRGRPLSWIKFDECSGTIANDSGLLLNAGTISIGASGTQTAAGTCTSGSAAEAWSNGATGKFNSGMNFDGTDDVVTLPANTSYDLSATTGGSAFLWVQKNSICDSANSNNNELFLNLWGGSHTGNTWWIGCLGHNQSPANALTFRHNGVVFSYTPLTFPNSSWQHIGFVYTGTEIRYYVNGVQVGTNAFTGNVTSTSPVCIGNYNAGCTDTYRYNGRIDDVRLYNYPLTDTQVKVLMNEGAAIRFGP